jgi:hypothetical protein
MDLGTSLMVGAVLGAVCGIANAWDKSRARKEDAETRLAGEHKIVCPQCQERGFVTTDKVIERTGIHGGKASAAILTGGVSMLATGLSNELERTKATCSNCGSTWRY